MKYSSYVVALVVVGVLGLIGVGFVGTSTAAPEVAAPAPQSEAEIEPTAVSVEVESGQRTVVTDATLADGIAPRAISGTVTDGHGAPIEGAHCTLLRGTAPAGLAGLVSRARPAALPVASAAADVRGAFRFAVPEGFWMLRIEADGMSPWQEDALRAGDERHVRLRPVREVVVRVLDDVGGIVAEAEVSLRKGEFSGPHQAWATERTDAGGVARLTAVPSETWYAHVRHRDYVAAVRAVPTTDEPLEFVLTRGVRVVGSVQLAGGQALPSPARVVFDAPDGMRSSHAVETDARGHFASATVFRRHRTLEVAAQVSGFGEVRREVDLAGTGSAAEVRVELIADAMERHAAGRVLDHDGAPLAGVEVYVVPLVALPPETVIRIPSGPEILEHGLPNLSAYDPQESKVARLRCAARSAADGSFRISGLHPQRSYKVLLVAERHANATLWIEPDESGATTELGTVELGAGGRVWGFVRRPDGTPIEGALVYTAAHTHWNLEPDTEFQTRRPATMRSLLEATTNQDGMFSIEPFPAAEFQLMCRGTAFGPYAVADGEVLGPLELVADDVHRRDGENSATVVLHVLDESSAPVMGAYAQMLRIRPDDGGAAEFSFHDWTYGRGDRAGRIALRAAAGLYEVEVKDLHGDFTPQTLVVELTAADVEEEVFLRAVPVRAPVLAGVVRTELGEPVSKLRIILVPETGEISCNCLKLSVHTDARGAFTFGRFMPGNHRILVVDPEGRAPPVQYYPARPGDEIVLTLGASPLVSAGPVTLPIGGAR